MDIAEAVTIRKSIRAFKADPVPKKMLQEILGLATRAPSHDNAQPWEFTVVGGKKLEALKQALAQKVDETPYPDIPLPPFPEPYELRRRTLGRKVYELKGIAREDREKRREWRRQMCQLFGAPNAIFIYFDQILNTNGYLNARAVFDCGLVAMNIMLLAPKYGLGTCPEMVPILYPDVVRHLLDIPETKLFVTAIAIGYPDWDEPINQLVTEREPLSNIATWQGFDDHQG